VCACVCVCVCGGGRRRGLNLDGEFVALGAAG